jgi:hypothetical protein
MTKFAKPIKDTFVAIAQQMVFRGYYVAEFLKSKSETKETVETEPVESSKD